MEKTREKLTLQDNLQIVCLTSAIHGKRTETWAEVVIIQKEKP